MVMTGGWFMALFYPHECTMFCYFGETENMFCFLWNHETNNWKTPTWNQASHRVILEDSCDPLIQPVKSQFGDVLASIFV